MSRNNYRSYEAYNDPYQTSDTEFVSVKTNGYKNRKVQPSKQGVILSIDKRSMNSNGNLANLGKPLIFVMVKGEHCGYCKMAFPAFQSLAESLANNPKIGLAVLQSDKERDLYSNISKIFGIRGVPTYLLFANGSKIAEYPGDRSHDDMIQWLGKYM